MASIESLLLGRTANLDLPSPFTHLPLHAPLTARSDSATAFLALPETLGSPAPPIAPYLTHLKAPRSSVAASLPPPSPPSLPLPHPQSPCLHSTAHWLPHPSPASPRS